MKIKLDFDTPNGTPSPLAIERRPTPRPEKPVCSYCFQPGFHQSAAQCLNALERAN
jgi:hypothetical protein